MVKEVEKWWDEAAPWFQDWAKLSTTSADYGPYAPRENQLKLLGNVKGKKILEIGCGGAQCSISFAKQGAICTGIDITQAQLDYAKKLAEKEKVRIKLIRGDIQTLHGIKSNSYDIVFSAFTLMYIADLTKCFKEVHRVLKKNGLFIFSAGHPFFIFDPKTKRLKRSYFKTGRIVEEEKWSDGTKHKFIFFHRKVSDIVNSIIAADITLLEMHEPLDMKNKIKDAVSYPEDIIRLVGPTIIFKTQKK
ncbi:MAG: class I SAM-dependent methyltransferase [Candidatus Aenigmarchaeota archaeon]|nr:class I SAM-dependent methyltransferase [Candidatus Aenigmarchaeota archaeon]